MKRLTWVVCLFAICALAWAGCDSSDDGKDAVSEGGDKDGAGTGEEQKGEEPSGDFTSESACNAIFECVESNNGFTSVEECVELYTLDCKDADGFLGCTEGCYQEKACDAFSECEPACWETHCKQ